MKIQSWAILPFAVLAVTAAGCKSGPSYKAPKGGLMVSDPCGLQVTATAVRPGRAGFTVTFDLANESDTGLLVPLAGLEAMWGQQLATVEVDARAIKKQKPPVPVPMLKMPGAIDSGLFAGTHWVTGSKGEGPGGEAVFLRARSRVSDLRVDCKVPPQVGDALVVRWPHVYTGDAQGTIAATVANNFTWSMLPTDPAAEAAK